MQTHPAVFRPLRWSSAASATLFLLATSLSAQTSSAETAAEADEVVELSPFNVVADTRGYQSFNTLSGTRLNSKLEDLGASITVVTKQQMLDTAVLDINDVFRYEASTEGTANFTTFNRNRSGGINVTRSGPGGPVMGRPGDRDCTVGPG